MASTIRPRPRIPEPAPDAGNVVVLQRPALPIVILFTEVSGKPTFLVLKLDPSIQIHLPSCDCGSHKEKKQADCLRTVLECHPPKREKFSITQLSANHSADLSSWNIALFGHPRHPDLDGIEKVKGVRWISLDGQTPEERADLQSSLNIIGRIRDKQQREYDAQEALISRRAERPRQYQTLALPVRISRTFSPLSSPSSRSESFSTRSIISEDDKDKEYRLL